MLISLSVIKLLTVLLVYLIILMRRCEKQEPRSSLVNPVNSVL